MRSSPHPLTCEFKACGAPRGNQCPTASRTRSTICAGVTARMQR